MDPCTSLSKEIYGHFYVKLLEMRGVMVNIYEGAFNALIINQEVILNNFANFDRHPLCKYFDFGQTTQGWAGPTVPAVPGVVPVQEDEDGREKEEEEV